jgi:hypothetical protein
LYIEPTYKQGEFMKQSVFILTNIAALMMSTITMAGPLEKEMKVRGTGPIAVTCHQPLGEVVRVNTNRLISTSKPAKLIAMGFGPNRGDEGFQTLTGNCEITMNGVAAAPAGRCYAIGRVGGEDRACAVHTTQQACESLEKWERCGWDAN